MHLSRIIMYPVKSCRGTALDRAQVGRRGIEGDRRWMVVTPAGRFLTQREHPRLALIGPELSDEALVLRAPGSSDLRLDRNASGRTVEVRVWQDRCAAVDEGDGAAHWLSSFLGASCRLVRQADEADRTVDNLRPSSTPAEVSLVDAYPFHLATEASFADLNARLCRPVPMDRFRPNLVVAGTCAWEEDRWRAIQIGALDFDVVQPCVRCVITTVDQATGEKEHEPLATLARFRRAPLGSSGGVFFGQYLIHRSEGTLDAGAAVRVLK